MNKKGDERMRTWDDKQPEPSAMSLPGRQHWYEVNGEKFQYLASVYAGESENNFAKSYPNRTRQLSTNGAKTSFENVHVIPDQ